MDESKNIISSILLKASNILDLDTTQLNDLKHIVSSTLDGFEINEKKNFLPTISECRKDLLLIEEFFVHKKLKGLSDSTMEKYKQDYKMLLGYFYGKKTLEDLTTTDIEKFLYEYQKTRNTSNTTLDGMRRTYCVLFGWLKEREFIKTNPMTGIGRFKSDTIPEPIFSSVEMKKIELACNDYRELAIVNLLYSSGVRISELCLLDRSDVDFRTGNTLVHGKGGKDRYVMINDITMYFLQNYLDQRTDNNECLFAITKRPYGRVSKGSIQSTLKKIAERAGVENVHAHRYRKTFCTHMIRNGTDLDVVQDLMGHDDVSTTMIYFRQSKERMNYQYKRAMNM